jgi:RNA polymerase sigma factor (sigma-70 family)
VRGDADADDLVQDTFLAAIRHPPLDDRPVRGWLTEVARNAGRMQARSTARRAKREAAAAGVDAAAPPADVLLSRLSAQRRLSELVADLPEPVRTTVLLRYLEGVPAAEIARQQGVPAGTVRWRLKTGLDTLRAELDRETGDRRRWCMLLMPLADREGGIGMITKQIARAVWFMGRATKLVVAGIVALAALLGWLRFGGWRGDSDSDAAAKRAASVETARSRGSKPGAITLPGPAIPRVPEAQVERDAAAEHGAFEGRVINWSSGQGVPGAEVTFSIDGALSVVSADDDGRFELLPARSGRSVLVMARAAGFLPFAPDLGHSPFELFARPGVQVRDITVQLAPALDYTGIVVDPAGKPVAGATVTLLGVAQGEQALAPLRDHFTSDEKGEFTFHAPDEALLEARHPSFGTGRARMAGAALVSHRLTLALPAKDGAPLLGTEHISGRVVDGEGAPVPGALVEATQSSHDKEDAKGASGQATTDAAGRFTIEGLDPGSHRVRASRAGYGTKIAAPVAAGTADLVLDLRRGASVSGRVVEGEGGAPLPSFNVLVDLRQGPLEEISVVVRSVVDAEGRFSVPDIGPGQYRVRATAYGHSPSAPIDVAVTDAPVGPLEIRMGRGGTLVGRLVETDSGEPIEGARVSIHGHAEASTAAPALINALTNKRGEFELSGVPVGTRSLFLDAYAHHMRIVSGVRFDEGVTTGPLTFDLARTRDGERPHQELIGVGISTDPDGDGLRILSVHAAGSAIQAGITAGDTILAVDGASVVGMGMEETVEHIRGTEGSTVRLTVRKSDGTVVDFVVTRRRIQS